MAPASPAWTIEYQTPTVDLDASGRAVRGVRVGYMIYASGVKDSVFVPQARYNADTVKAAVQAAVDNHNAITKLQG